MRAEARRLEDVPRQGVAHIVVALRGAEAGAADGGVVTERVHRGLARWEVEGSADMKEVCFGEVKVTAWQEERGGREGHGEEGGARQKAPSGGSRIARGTCGDV